MHGAFDKGAHSPRILFVLCVERLGHWIQRKVEEGRWKPLRASRGGRMISHLFFADDLLLFAEATIDQANCIREGLEGFCSASGQRVNFGKFLLHVSPNMEGGIASELSARLGIPLMGEL